MAAEGRRAANVSAAERSLLIDLVCKYATVIEDKATDKVTVAEKAAAWKRLADEFNAVSCIKRSSEQLKQAYGNIKKMTKKELAKGKVEHFRTGGGPFKATEVDEKVLSLLGNRAQPLHNAFDSDAGYTSGCPPVSTLEITSDGSLLVVPVQQSSSVMQASAVASFPATTVSTVTTVMATVATATATVTTTPSATVMATTATTTADPAVTIPARKPWAGKRRPRPSSVATVRHDAAATIATAAQYQKDYYEAKLEMAREKHAAKMRILALKENILKKSLQEE